MDAWPYSCISQQVCARDILANVDRDTLGGEVHDAVDGSTVIATASLDSEYLGPQIEHAKWRVGIEGRVLATHGYELADTRENTGLKAVRIGKLAFHG